ncbi:MAG TPA: hypothetical protein VIK18_11535 [Pirellulales bacterium]
MQVKGILLAVVMLLPGCASLQDFHYETTNGLRSQFAWYHAAPNVRQGLCPSDYGKGWRLGYFAVTMGGGSHPPSFPPTHYWSAHYQSPAGQAEIAAWYRGYQDGAIRAERRGAGSFHYLHAHDTGSHDSGPGPAPVVETPPPSPPAVEQEPIPAGSKSIRHSKAIRRDSTRTADARAGVRQPGGLSARVLPAPPEVQDNSSPPGETIVQASSVPADYFPAPPPVTLSQPTSMQPAAEEPASRPAAAAGTGIERSSWTTDQSEAPAKPSALQRLVQRLPPVFPPLFGAPAPDATTDKP